MKVGIFGDVHGDWDSVKDWMNDVYSSAWLCVGDLTTYNATIDRPLYFIEGNHEDLNILEAMDNGTLVTRNLRHIKPGEVVMVNGFKVAGLGGNYSPKHFDDKKRVGSWFTKRDIKTMLNMKAQRRAPVDILLTHEPPAIAHDMGIPQLDCLLKLVKPGGVWFYGHHHEREHTVVNGVNIVGLCRPSKGIGMYPHESLKQEKQ